MKIHRRVRRIPRWSDALKKAGFTVADILGTKPRMDNTRIYVQGDPMKPTLPQRAEIIRRFMGGDSLMEISQYVIEEIHWSSNEEGRALAEDVVRDYLIHLHQIARDHEECY